MLYGGAKSGGVTSNETWLFTPSPPTWSKDDTGISPPALSSHGLAYDPVRGKAVVFGGKDANHNAYGGTWLYDGTDWTQIDQSGCGPVRPVPRISPDIEWDGEKIVLYGGEVATTDFLDDTWFLRPGDVCWTRDPLSVIDNPGQRSHHQMTYSSVRDDILMFGGSVETAPGTTVLVNDTWFYERGVGWRICPFFDHLCGSPPANRCCMGLASEPGGLGAQGRTVLFGGGTLGLVQYRDTWRWSDGSDPQVDGWRCVSPAYCVPA